MPAKKTAKKPSKTTKPAIPAVPQRGQGKRQTSISLSESSLSRAREKAAEDGRSLSNWLEQLIRNQRDAE